ncbi:MAG: hypothetical protein HY002_05565 [Candidatus Rokubacteria bacterium]|nr:hypothetical protein [Candidatus Rokubacteria bacterium]
MEPDTASREASQCPFFVAVMADQLWLDPVSAYCRTPGGRVRVPAEATAWGLCMTAAHRLCPGYLAAVAEPRRSASATG